MRKLDNYEKHLSFYIEMKNIKCFVIIHKRCWMKSFNVKIHLKQNVAKINFQSDLKLSLRMYNSNNPFYHLNKCINYYAPFFLNVSTKQFDNMIFVMMVFIMYNYVANHLSYCNCCVWYFCKWKMIEKGCL